MSTSVKSLNTVSTNNENIELSFSWKGNTQFSKCHIQNIRFIFAETKKQILADVSKLDNNTCSFICIEQEEETKELKKITCEKLKVSSEQLQSLKVVIDFFDFVKNPEEALYSKECPITKGNIKQNESYRLMIMSNEPKLELFLLNESSISSISTSYENSTLLTSEQKKFSTYLAAILASPFKEYVKKSCIFEGANKEIFRVELANEDIIRSIQNEVKKIDPKLLEQYIEQMEHLERVSMPSPEERHELNRKKFKIIFEALNAESFLNIALDLFPAALPRNSGASRNLIRNLAETIQKSLNLA